MVGNPTEFFALAEEHFLGVPRLIRCGDRKAIVECSITAHCYVESTMPLMAHTALVYQQPMIVLALRHLDALSTDHPSTESLHHAYTLLSWIADWARYIWHSQLPMQPTSALA